nr:hypothetical protein [Tanacetum cinerariifolium]
MICMRDDIPQRGHATLEEICIYCSPTWGLIHSPGHDARTIAKAANRVEDVGYVRALQDSEHRMMTSIEEVNLRISYQAQARRQENCDLKLLKIITFASSLQYHRESCYLVKLETFGPTCSYFYFDLKAIA